MIQAVDFDAESLPNWKWSARPGAAERHLRRRHSNPLFPLHRQMVTAHDVHKARLADNLALEDIRNELSEVCHAFFEKPEWCATIGKSAFATTMMAGGEESKAA
jgi:hypothetical protein